MNQGTVIFGSNEAAHALGRLLRDAGEEVIFLDRNPATCHVVEQDGFKVIFGNAMEERTLQRARLDERAACVAATINEWANLLFIKKATEDFKIRRAYAAVQSDDAGVNEAMVHKEEGIVLFGKARDVEAWSLRIRHGETDFETWQLKGEPPEDHPAYYVRFCKSFSRMGGAMRYAGADNRDFLLALLRALRAAALPDSHLGQ